MGSGHGKPIVKTTIPPTGVMAFIRSTGSVTPFGFLLALMIFYRQTLYFTELPGSAIVISSFLHPQDVLQSHAPHWQDSQRYACGSARNDDECESSETWRAGMNHIHNVLPRFSRAPTNTILAPSRKVQHQHAPVYSVVCSLSLFVTERGNATADGPTFRELETYTPAPRSRSNTMVEEVCIQANLWYRLRGRSFVGRSLG